MRKFLAVIMCVMVMTFMTGCNRDMLDTTFSYDKAIISLPNGEFVEGEVDNWRDYEDGDSIQVKIDGVTYLTHISNVVLIAE